MSLSPVPALAAHPLAAGTRLVSLAAEILDADATPTSPARADRLAVLAWRMLGELSEAASGRVDADARLWEVVAAAQASIIAAGVPRTARMRIRRVMAHGMAPDPLIQVRHALARHGWLPGPGVSGAQVLAAGPGRCGNTWQT
jgi:hypothetical protein